MINIKRLRILTVFLIGFLTSFSSSAQKINQFDSNKKRTGVWKKFYPNNQIRYEGQFKAGKEVGVFKFYRKSYPNSPASIKYYNEQNDSVKVEFYSIKGKLETKGYYIEKARVGKWVYYFANGKLRSVENYSNGKLNGKLVNYYPNGKITEETIYVNGLKNGSSKKYSSDGILIEEVIYKNNKLNGLAKYYELNGNLKEKGIYKDGKRFGKWDYYLDGEVADDEELKKKKIFKKNEK